MTARRDRGSQAAAVRAALRDAPLPGAEDARRRAWTVVRASTRSADHGVAAAGRRRGITVGRRGAGVPAHGGDTAAALGALVGTARRGRRRVAAALLAAAAVALALSPPGAAVGEWVRDRVDPPVAEPAATPAIRLPAPGRLLVRDSLGITVVGRDGDRVRLGQFDGATWSPNGWFAAAWGGDRLSALTPGGTVRWTITAPGRVVAARWSPDPGYRIAYVTAAGALGVVNGDGTGDRPLGAAVPRPAPAWRPGARTELAYVTPRGRLVIRDVDTGARVTLPRRALPRRVHTLTWTAGGRVLAAVGPRAAHMVELRRPGRVARLDPPAGARFTAAAYAPTHPTLARVTRARGRSTVVAGREVFTTRGRIAGLAWSADGRWLMLDTPDAGQLVAVRVVGPPRVLSFPGGRLHGWSK
jgi:hypothetical protein